MIDPRDLLDEIVGLIKRDVEAIKNAPGKLSHQEALDLVRYSGAILDIVVRKDLDRETEQKKLSKLSNEDLRREAAKVLEKYEKVDESGNNKVLPNSGVQKTE